MFGRKKRGEKFFSLSKQLDEERRIFELKRNALFIECKTKTVLLSQEALFKRYFCVDNKEGDIDRVLKEKIDKLVKDYLIDFEKALEEYHKKADQLLAELEKLLD